MEPRGSGWAVLKDGGGDRRLCLECLGTVVLDSKDAQPLYGEVRLSPGMGIMGIKVGWGELC
jgi:hypothetical protein